ncbi:MAG TPA: sigma-70 family RNA polymerase sigma factor [Tepidisphaeraceae bacterium]|nr:sigma-70 family RNA polymerase sigma factor [Tepidisphaeraceae bacterium]
MEIRTLEVSDADLVRAATAGDDGAFHALIDRHATGLMRVAMSMAHRREDAEDLMQETFIGAYRGLKNFEHRSSIRTWLTQILTRQAAKAWHRSRHHRKALSIHRGDEESTTSGPLEMGTTRPARSMEQRLDVNEVLQQLSPQFREILTLREVRGLSYDEIAAVINVPRGTVESRLFRARAEFRSKMGPLE